MRLINISATNCNTYPELCYRIQASNNKMFIKTASFSLKQIITYNSVQLTNVSMGYVAINNTWTLGKKDIKSLNNRLMIQRV